MKPAGHRVLEPLVLRNRLVVDDVAEVCQCRVAARRLMREHDLQPRQRRHFIATTDSDHDGPIFPN